MTETLAPTARTMSITKSGSGLPCLWESGGGLTSRGHATVITRRDGAKPRAIYIPTRGPLACGDHALVPIHPGYGVVSVSTSHGVIDAGKIEIIKEITDDTVTLELVSEFVFGEWTKPVPSLEAAIEAATKKASTYHCREAVWVEAPIRKEVTR